MKRLFAFIAVLLLFGVASQAQANVFNTPGAYKIKFEGFEYAYYGTNSSFMSGGVQGDDLISDLSQLVDSNNNYSLVTGFNMTALIYATQISSVLPGGVMGDLHYSLGDQGMYVSVLRDLVASDSSGSISFTDPSQKAHISFTGGVIDWYYLPTASMQEFSGLNYVPGQGLVYNGEVLNLSDPFASLRLSSLSPDTDITGLATISFKEGHLTGSAEFFADLDLLNSSFPWMDTDSFGGHDMLFQSDIKWFDETHRFTVDDPARVDVATPEPASMALLGAGLAALGMMARRRRAS